MWFLRQQYLLMILYLSTCVSVNPHQWHPSAQIVFNWGSRTCVINWSTVGSRKRIHAPSYSMRCAEFDSSHNLCASMRGSMAVMTESDLNPETGLWPGVFVSKIAWPKWAFTRSRKLAHYLLGCLWFVVVSSSERIVLVILVGSHLAGSRGNESSWTGGFFETQNDGAFFIHALSWLSAHCFFTPLCFFLSFWFFIL